MRTVVAVLLAVIMPLIEAQAQKPGAAPAPAPQGRQTRPSRDPYVGTFAASDLIITLRRSPQGYTGMAQSGGGQYPIVARLANGVLNGTYTDNGAQRGFQAVVQGDVMQLQADGTQFMLQRQTQMAEGAMGQTAQPGQPAPTGPPGGGAVATSAQDQQIAQFLMANRWCAFSYSQTSGRTSTEQVQFNRDGTATRGAQSETQSSNPNGSYYGNSQGGDRGYWRIQGGQLMLSQDGVQWGVQPVQLTRNSNGSPILNSGGKEYMVCN